PVPFDNEPDMQSLLDRFFIMGTPERCIAKLHELREAMGLNHFNASFWFGDLSQEQVLNSMTLFAEEVMPAFE
ncbi:MAG: hypothetical protein AAF942_09590, partial [Pseudomonadota bacterium]